MMSQPQLDAVRPVIMDWFGRASLCVWGVFERALSESDSVLTALDPFDVVVDKIIKSVSRSAENERKRTS